MNDITKQQKNQALNLIDAAQAMMLEALDYLKDANAILKDNHAKAYLLDHMDIMFSADHHFLTRDMNLDEWKNDIEEQYEEYEMMAKDSETWTDPAGGVHFGDGNYDDPDYDPAGMYA